MSVLNGLNLENMFGLSRGTKQTVRKNEVSLSSGCPLSGARLYLYNSTNASGAEEIPETNKLSNMNGLRIPTGRRQISWLFTSVVEDLNLIWTRDYREQIQLAVKAGLELGASELQVRRSNHSATMPPQEWKDISLRKRLHN